MRSAYNNSAFKVFLYVKDEIDIPLATTSVKFKFWVGCTRFTTMKDTVVFKVLFAK